MYARVQRKWSLNVKNTNCNKNIIKEKKTSIPSNLSNLTNLSNLSNLSENHNNRNNIKNKNKNKNNVSNLKNLNNLNKKKKKRKRKNNRNLIISIESIVTLSVAPRAKAKKNRTTKPMSLMRLVVALTMLLLFVCTPVNVATAAAVINVGTSSTTTFIIEHQQQQQQQQHKQQEQQHKQQEQEQHKQEQEQHEQEQELEMYTNMMRTETVSNGTIIKSTAPAIELTTTIRTKTTKNATIFFGANVQRRINILTDTDAKLGINVDAEVAATTENVGHIEESYFIPVISYNSEDNSTKVANNIFYTNRLQNKISRSSSSSGSSSSRQNSDNKKISFNNNNNNNNQNISLNFSIKSLKSTQNKLQNVQLTPATFANNILTTSSSTSTLTSTLTSTSLKNDSINIEDKNDNESDRKKSLLATLVEIKTANQQQKVPKLENSQKLNLFNKNIYKNFNTYDEIKLARYTFNDSNSNSSNSSNSHNSYNSNSNSKNHNYKNNNKSNDNGNDNDNDNGKISDDSNISDATMQHWQQRNDQNITRKSLNTIFSTKTRRHVERVNDQLPIGISTMRVPQNSLDAYKLSSNSNSNLNSNLQPTTIRTPTSLTSLSLTSLTSEAESESAFETATVKTALLPFRYIIEAYEVPSSLPYSRSSKLTDFRRRMLLHQQPMHRALMPKDQLQEQLTARNRRDSRTFGTVRQDFDAASVASAASDLEQNVGANGNDYRVHYYKTPFQHQQRFQYHQQQQQQQQPQIQQSQQQQQQHLSMLNLNGNNNFQVLQQQQQQQQQQQHEEQEQEQQSNYQNHYMQHKQHQPHNQHQLYYQEATQNQQQQQPQLHQPQQQQQQNHNYQNQYQYKQQIQSKEIENKQHEEIQQQSVRRSHQRYPQRQRKHGRRYCSARDPAQLAFEAPTVFEGKIISMTPDRRANFAATVKVVEIFKQQILFSLQKYVRLRFAYRNTSGECDIYREQLRPRGLVRGDELEQGRVYLMFVRQIDLGNFTILGQPIQKTRRVVNSVKEAVSENYAQFASIRSITASNRTVENGKELRIICKVQGRPPPKVTWFKDHKSINSNRKLYQFVHYKKRSELIIRSFNSSDAGRYECRAKNKVNRNIERRTIVIKAYPVPRYEPHLTGGTGNNCPDDASEFCFNGGTCKFFSEIGSYSCICPEGFIGERCDRKEVNSMPPSTYSNEQECGEKKFLGSYYC